MLPATELSAAIWRTMRYGDVFDHALTAAEIHRYLHHYTAAPAQVVQALDTADFVAHEQGLYTLAGRGDLIPLRHEREHRAQQMWPAAWHYGRWLARVPFVRMVAITGSLAVNNPNPTADTDYFLLTAPQRVWLARLFCLALVRTAAQRGHTLCPNYFLASSALALTPHNLYTARELTQMVPVAGADFYHQLRRANAWTAAFLPNAIGWPPHAYAPSPHITPTPLEPLLVKPLAQRLETWERTRKIAKLSRMGLTTETQFTAEQCKGHFDGHQTRTLRQWHNHQSPISSPMETSSAPRTDILFGQSYYLRFDPKLYEAMKPYPPLGTMIAAALMRQQGYSVALFDAMLAESTAEWTAAVHHHQPRYAILYEDNFNYLSKMCLLNMRQAAVEMIAAAKANHATVILCGSDATDHPELYLRAGADYVLQGEGEETLTELLAWLANSPTAAPTHIAGLIWQDGTTERRPSMRHIDQLPFPAWDLINVAHYRQLWLTHHGYYSMNMVTTRGCPYHCNWCAKPIWGQRYACRSAESVAAELKWLRENYSPDHIWFVDDIMGLKPAWWQEFAAAVERENIRTPFKCLSRADLIVRHPDNVHALRRAGCEIVWLGAESGAQTVLDAMEKGTTVAQIYEAAAQLHAAGVQVAFFLQFGYPGETLADIEKTLQMVRDCQPDDIGMSVSYPLPGTRFYERVKLELGTQQNWTDSADLAMLHHGPFPTSFYRQLHRVLHHEFRARQGWRALRHIVRHPTRWRPSHGRQLLTTVYNALRWPLARRQLQRLAQAAPHAITLPHMPYTQAAEPTEQ